MHDTIEIKGYALAIVLCTMLIGFSLYFGWDSDGFYLRQALLVFAGYATGALIILIKEIGE